MELKECTAVWSREERERSTGGLTHGRKKQVSALQAVWERHPRRCDVRETMRTARYLCRYFQRTAIEPVALLLTMIQSNGGKSLSELKLEFGSTLPYAYCQFQMPGRFLVNFKKIKNVGNQVILVSY